MHPPGWYSWLRLPHSRWNQLRSASSDFVSACSALRHLRAGPVVVVLALSTLHIVCRLALLPALLSDSLSASLVIPAVAWPLLLLYAGALVPIPGGGGAVELGFAGSIGEMLGPAAGAALLWWRVYTFHALVLAGGIVLFAATIAPRTARKAPPDDCIEEDAARQPPRYPPPARAG
jgi:hypothetical protein